MMLKSRCWWQRMRRNSSPADLQTLSTHSVTGKPFLSSNGFWYCPHRFGTRSGYLGHCPSDSKYHRKIAAGLADDLLTSWSWLRKHRCSSVLLWTQICMKMSSSGKTSRNLPPGDTIWWRRILVNWPVNLKEREGFPNCLISSKRVKSILTEKDLAGETVLVTAGPTREPLDPVRFYYKLFLRENGLCPGQQGQGEEVRLWYWLADPRYCPCQEGSPMCQFDAVEMRHAVHEKSEAIHQSSSNPPAVAGLSAVRLCWPQNKEEDGPMDTLPGEESRYYCRDRKKEKRTDPDWFCHGSEDLIKMQRRNARQKYGPDRSERCETKGCGISGRYKHVKILDRDGGMKRNCR